MQLKLQSVPNPNQHTRQHARTSKSAVCVGSSHLLLVLHIYSRSLSCRRRNLVVSHMSTQWYCVMDKNLNTERPTLPPLYSIFVYSIIICHYNVVITCRVLSDSIDGAWHSSNNQGVCI